MSPQVNDAARGGRSIGELCLAADLAWVNGDATGLREILERLAVQLPEPIHCELTQLASTCCGDPARAFSAWPALRDRLVGASGR